jgi:D-ribitol-5-phosphate cytidylyltransferase
MVRNATRGRGADGVFTVRNIALIFAGGTGRRMSSASRPKQFLELHGKPIIVYTLEVFEAHPQVDAVVVVCLADWIGFLEDRVARAGLKKVQAIVAGGCDGQASIRNGVRACAGRYPEDSCVLVHDGVRPLVDAATISRCIECVRAHGSAVTVVPAIETIVRQEGGVVTEIVDRASCEMARAPQAFLLGELARAHERAVEDGLGSAFIDTAGLMAHYGCELRVVEGNPENIKITTPVDFYSFAGIVDGAAGMFDAGEGRVFGAAGGNGADEGDAFGAAGEGGGRV